MIWDFIFLFLQQKPFSGYLLRMTRHIIFLFQCEVPVPSLTSLSCNLKIYQEIPQSSTGFSQSKIDTQPYQHSFPSDYMYDADHEVLNLHFQAPSVTLGYLANYLAELTLTDYNFLRFLPSVVAASAVFLARWTLDQSDLPWVRTKTLNTDLCTSCGNKFFSPLIYVISLTELYSRALHLIQKL